MRWLLLGALISTTAFAGPRGRGNVNFRFITPWLIASPRTTPAPTIVYQQPVYWPLAWWTWYPMQQPVQPPPAPEPEPIVIEREVVREVPAPAPQVIIVEREPAPVPQAAPAPPPPPVEPAKPLPPQTPGPDVYTWTDDDGVVHFSTRVPASAKARATKVGANR